MIQRIYYEKIGILLPAYVDPRTKYRYYSAKQLLELDIIHLCIMLGIPLKELKTYTSPQGGIEIRKLLEDGKKVAEQRIAETRFHLEQIQYSLDNIQHMQEYQRQQGIYSREFPERILIVSDPFTNILDRKQVRKCSHSLHEYAHQNGLFPMLPAGMLIQYGAGGSTPIHRMFFGITNTQAEDSRILTLPSGLYQCAKACLDTHKDIKDRISHLFGSQEHTTVIVANIMPEKLSFQEIMTEIQLLAQ